jgi:DNA repair exonuclease SbcCD ATPase subunit
MNLKFIIILFITMDNINKTCSKCKRELSLNHFHKTKTGKYGVMSKCKDCRKEYNKEYNKINKEKIKEYNKEYKNSENNKEKILEKAKEYYKNNKQKILEHNKEYKKEYYKNNKEKILEYSKEYSKNNKQKIKEKDKEYYKNNKQNCIYYYSFNNIVLYVGSTVCPLKRKNKHKNQNILPFHRYLKDNSIKYENLEYTQVDLPNYILDKHRFSTEQYYINTLKPICNKKEAIY